MTTHSYKRWTYQEYRTLKAMKQAGYSATAIARALHRGVESVKAKIIESSYARPRVKILKALRHVTPKITLTVKHADVPAWYELGWRFAGFDGDLCVFEWPAGHRPPQWPEQGRVA